MGFNQIILPVSHLQKNDNQTKTNAIVRTISNANQFCKYDERTHLKNGFCMNIFDPLFYDTIAIAAIVISVLLAFFKGFMREFLSLAEWVGAFFVTYFFHESISNFLSRFIPVGRGIDLISVTVTFIVTFLVFYAVGRVILSYIKDNLSPSVDRFLGLIFGFLRGLLIPCIIFNFLLILAVSPKMVRGIMDSYSYDTVSFITYHLYGKRPEQIMKEKNRALQDSLEEL